LQDSTCASLTRQSGNDIILLRRRATLSVNRQALEAAGAEFTGLVIARVRAQKSANTTRSKVRGAEVAKESLVTSTGDQPQVVGAERGHLPEGIDKRTLTVPAPRRYRNKAHLRYVALQPCLLCGRKPSEPREIARSFEPDAHSPAVGRGSVHKIFKRTVEMCLKELFKDDVSVFVGRSSLPPHNNKGFQPCTQCGSEVCR
jgi:hypothetical protein